MSLSLKPSDTPSKLVTSEPITLLEYKAKLMKKISSILKLNNRLGIVLYNIMNIKKSGDKIFGVGKSNNVPGANRIKPDELAEINKHFAECLGPWLIAEFGLIKKVHFSDIHSKCLYPESQIHGFYDFELFDDKGECYLISNKRLVGIANTVKTKNITLIIKKYKLLCEKWSGTEQLKTLDIIEKSSITTGPLKVIKLVYPDKSPMSKGELNDLIEAMETKNVIPNIEAVSKYYKMPNSLIKMIENDSVSYKQYRLNNNVASSVMICLLFGKLITEITKEDQKYSEIYYDAMNTKDGAYILKFGLSPGGVVNFELIDPAHRAKKVYLTYKFGIEATGSLSTMGYLV